MKTLKEQAQEWAADFWGDASYHGIDGFDRRFTQGLCRSAGAIGYLVGHNAALANIELDEGDLLGCCADYAQLEADGNGTAGMFLSDYPAEIMSQAYYEGAKLAVERIKEGRWTKE